MPRPGPVDPQRDYPHPEFVNWTDLTPLLLPDLRARLKTRSLNFRSNPQEYSMVLHLDIDLGQGLKGPHLRDSGSQGDAKCKFRHRPFRRSMGVSRTDAAQASSNG